MVLNSAAHIERTVSKDDDNRLLAFLLPENRLVFLQALYFLDKEWSAETDASAVHIAAYMGLTHVIGELVDAGEDVNAQDPFGATPLMYAAARGPAATAAVDRLLSIGADPTLTCPAGSTALIRAIESNAVAAVERLLQEPDVNINAAPVGFAGQDKPALIASISLGYVPIFKMLLARKELDVNVFERFGDMDAMSALHLATRNSELWAMSGLLSHPDIQVDIVDMEGWTPLFYASANGFVDGIDMLVGRGADITHVDENRGTALMRAVDDDQATCVQKLLNLGSDIAHRDFLGRTVLHSAAMRSTWDALRVLLQDAKRLEVNCQGAAGETPLHDACMYADHTGVSILVAAGARCDIRNKEGRTPIDLAMARKRDDIVSVLRTAEGYANINETRFTKSLAEAVARDPSEILFRRIKAATMVELNTTSAFEGTPLNIACRAGRTDVVEMLLEAGADPNLMNKFGRTPLHHAVEARSLSCVQALVSHGADVNQTAVVNFVPWDFVLQDDNEYENAATEAAGSGPEDDLTDHSLWHRGGDIVMYLIEHSTSIRPELRFLQSTLRAAVKRNNVAVAQRLVETGASIHLKNHGETAIQLAERHKAVHVLTYFAKLDDALAGVKGSARPHAQTRGYQDKSHINPPVDRTVNGSDGLEIDKGATERSSEMQHIAPQGVLNGEDIQGKLAGHPDRRIGAAEWSAQAKFASLLVLLACVVLMLSIYMQRM